MTVAARRNYGIAKAAGHVLQLRRRKRRQSAEREGVQVDVDRRELAEDGVGNARPRIGRINDLRAWSSRRRHYRYILRIRSKERIVP